MSYDWLLSLFHWFSYELTHSIWLRAGSIMELTHQTWEWKTPNDSLKVKELGIRKHSNIL